jgi:heme-degrading monooxygenase HmoA
MVIRITWGRLRAGVWNEFESAYRANVIDGKTVEGLRWRFLVQDSGDKDTGFAMSLWDNQADMETFEQSGVFQEVLDPLKLFFVGDYKTHRCEVKYTDMAS